MELNDILLKIADGKQKNKVFELVLFGNLLNPFSFTHFCASRYYIFKAMINRHFKKLF